MNTHGGLAIAAMENPAGNYISPTAADTFSAVNTIANATTFPSSTGNWANVSFVNSPGKGDYPLAALSYFLVYQKVDAGYDATSVAKAQVLYQWLAYVLDPTQQSQAGPNNYVPVPSKLIQQNTAALATMTFDGAAIPACTTG
jgi:ABC-type phosphate transport system substrate-binding protein